MRRLIPPRCTSCHRANAGYESVRWPSVRLCYQCLRDVFEYIARTGIIDGNPILIELAEGVGDKFEWAGREYIRVWIPSVFSSSSSSELKVRLTQDSRSEVENPLDFLN